MATKLEGWTRLVQERLKAFICMLQMLALHGSNLQLDNTMPRGFEGGEKTQMKRSSLIVGWLLCRQSILWAGKPA